MRGHWSIENQLPWVLDVDFAEDQSRLRKGYGARNMAVIRHFGINAIRMAVEPARPPRPLARRPRNRAAGPRKTSLKLRRKIAGWDVHYLDAVLVQADCSIDLERAGVWQPPLVALCARTGIF